MNEYAIGNHVTLLLVCATTPYPLHPLHPDQIREISQWVTHYGRHCLLNTPPHAQRPGTQSNDQGGFAI